MSVDDDSSHSRIMATPRSAQPGKSEPSPPSRPSGQGTDERSGSLGPIPATGLGDPLAKQLAKRALFPRKIRPVQLGRFSVLKHIGQGGMGAVYACYDEQLDRKVAVKILHGDVLRDRGTARVRLLREAQAMARLSHPNIVTVHEVGQTDDVVYMAMEFIRGVTLDAWASQPRSWREILAGYLQAGRGLAAAHRAGLIHRDFKPQNVMIDEEGQVKILDFGLARASDGNVREELLESQADGSGGSGSHLMRPLTRTGTIIGTPAYMSPEQHRGEVATAASDQFSFCSSLYQGLYGALPFSTESYDVLRDDVAHGRVIVPPMSSPVPSRVFKALRRGMMADPRERFASMTELLAALERDPATMYRRLGALTATAAVAGAASFAVAGGERAVDVCPDARPELAGIWDATRAAVVRAAVQTAAPARADALLSAVESRLDRYAEGWVQLRNDACLAHAEGRQSPQLFDLRTACLDRRRAGLDAAVGAFAVADATTVDTVVQAVAGLPPLATCADAEALTAAIPPPADPRTRARVQLQREALARAEVHELTAQTGRGLQLVEAVLADPLASTYEPLRAEASLRKGSLLMLDGQSAAAMEAFDAALWTGLAIGHATVAAQTSSRRTFLRAYLLREPSRAKEELPLVDALNRRVHHDVELQSESLGAAAAVHALLGDWDRAVRLWSEVVAVREKHDRLDTPQGIGALFNISAHLQQVGNYEEAIALLRRVISLSEKVSGPQHPERPMYEAMVALNLVSLGRPREALELMHRLQMHVDQLESARNRQTGAYGLARAEFAAGDVRSAHRHLVDAQRASPESFTPRDWAWLMLLAATEADRPAMERARDAALAGLDALTDRRGVDYQELLLLHGQALAALGRHHEAVAPLEAARSALADSADPIHVLRGGRLSLELGRSRASSGELDAAERELRAALAGFEQVLSPRNLELADTALALGELALGRGRFDEAVEWSARAESIYATTAESDYIPLTRARAALARARAGAADPSVPGAPAR